MNLISSRYILINNSTKIIIILITENPFLLFDLSTPQVFCHFETNSFSPDVFTSFDDFSPLSEYRGL
jgi:hypothetical protein